MYQGKTIAFSTKANVWKTRYSFTPTCYMNMDNDFLSSNTTSVFSNDILWIHDVNETYNSFYGKPSEPSSIEVVSNDNPSAVKIFKSLSIESPTKGWTGSVYTNKDRGDEPMQMGDFHGFVEKEGNQYSAMPRSVINSSSNITFLGMVESGKVPTGFNTEFNSDGSWDVPLIGIPSVSVSPSQNSLAFFALGLRSINSDGQLILGTSGFDDKGLKITRYNDETNSITLKLNTPTPAQTIEYTAAMYAFLPSNQAIPVYIMTNPIKNGDGMRGPYVGVKLTLPDSSKAFELFAINVDYEKTKLDGSLG